MEVKICMQLPAMMTRTHQACKTKVTLGAMLGPNQMLQILAEAAIASAEVQAVLGMMGYSGAEVAIHSQPTVTAAMLWVMPHVLSCHPHYAFYPVKVLLSALIELTVQSAWTV